MKVILRCRKGILLTLILAQTMMLTAVPQFAAARNDSEANYQKDSSTPAFEYWRSVMMARYNGEAMPEQSPPETQMMETAPEDGQSMRTFNLTTFQAAPIRVYIESYPTETRLYKTRYYGYVENALNQWSQALNGRLRYTLVSNPNQAQIRVTWVGGFNEADQAGDTIYTVGDATIKIKTPDLPDNIIQGDIMHEFGHALGIGSHSEHNEDIMKTAREWRSYDEYHNYRPALSERDVRVIRRLYSANWRPGEDLYQAIDSETAMAPASASARVTGFFQKRNASIHVKPAPNLSENPQDTP